MTDLLEEQIELGALDTPADPADLAYVVIRMERSRVRNLVSKGVTGKKPG